MKATDLMCGDLILVDKRPTRVYGVMERMGRVYDTMTNDISLKRCEPIPLTPEIIEKNFPQEDNCGLKYNPHIGRTCDLENGNTLWIGKWHNGATRDEKERTGVDPAEGWWEIVYCEHPYLYEYGMKVRFVHELQHALRLCGIEKEIVL